MTSSDFPFVAGPIYRAATALSDTIPLYVHLVKGTNFAVWIDSGISRMFPQLWATMAEAGVEPEDLKFVLHTHSHHDHIGCNAQLKQATGCLLAAPAYYADWHADFERHYQEFARPFPHLVQDTQALRREVFEVLDAPCPLDLSIEEGVQVSLGGGICLQALSLPGHMLAEVGWFETTTRTLILGDAITGLDWPLFHSHLSVTAYRRTIDRLRRLLPEQNVAWVLSAHFPPMRPEAMQDLLDRADRYINAIEATLLDILATEREVTLETLWQGTCARMNRLAEFRALNMVAAHVQDLLARGVIQSTGQERYAVKED